MDDSHAMSLEQIRALVAANSVMRFAGQRRQEVYEWVERTLVRHQYAGLRKPDKGVLRLYLAQMTGLKRAQVTRLITGYQQTGRVIAAPYLRARFPSIYGRPLHRPGLPGQQGPLRPKTPATTASRPPLFAVVRLEVLYVRRSQRQTSWPATG